MAIDEVGTTSSSSWKNKVTLSAKGEEFRYRYTYIEREGGLLTHEARRHAQLDEGHVEDEARKDEEQRVEILNTWRIENGRGNQIDRYDQDHNGNDNWHFVGPWMVGFGVAHHDERQHGATIEYPSGEAEEINQRINCAVQHHGRGN